MASSQFPKEAYRAEVRKIARTWKSLPQDDRIAYQAQAEFEVFQREDARNTPLPSADSQQSLESNLGVKAAGKISTSRLVKNYDKANAHELWKQPTQMADRALMLPVA